jgi:hypothetical protein
MEQNFRPVVKTMVTSPGKREMQVRILPRDYARVVQMAGRQVFRCRMLPGFNSKRVVAGDP